MAHDENNPVASSRRRTRCIQGRTLTKYRESTEGGNMPDSIKDQLVRRLEELSPDELRVVRDLIDTFKGRSDRAISVRSRREGGKEEAGNSEEIDRAAASEAARQVRASLENVEGSLSDTVVEERRERV